MNMSPDNAESMKDAALATKHVCELLSRHHNHYNNREFQTWATVGFQCLANLSTSPELLDDYYDRVHTLAMLKFGAKTWEAFLSNNTKTNIGQNVDFLRPKDYKTLELLIEIYAQDEAHVERAQQLLKTAWRLYALEDLEDAIRKSTFHSILQTLCHKQRGKAKYQGQAESRDDRDFEYALSPLDKMMLRPKWWADADTFEALFGLARDGPQADIVMSKLELCQATTKEYALSQWIVSAKQGHPQAAE
jgi:hypothetical protein